jgi:tRNA 2-selenouridine synthase
VFVESESKKVGNLRVPEVLMERMRAAPCIAVQLGRAQRVRAADGGLRTLFRRSGGPERAAGTPGAAARARQDRSAWHALADGGRIAELVGQLLEEHYDPAYLKSIDRNFVRYPQAQIVELNGITPDDFAAAAQRLHGA